MSHKYNGSAFCIKFLKQDQNLKTGSRIQITCSLISENHRRIIDQSSGNCYTLHLSTRHLVALVIKSLAKTYSLQCLNRSILSLFRTYIRIIHQRKFYILYTCRLRQQVVVLEYKTNLTVSKNGTVISGHRSHADSIKIIFTTGWSIETTELVE